MATRLKRLPAWLALLVLALLAGSAGEPQRLTRAAAAAPVELALADDAAGRFRDAVQQPVAPDGSDAPDPDDASLPAAHRPDAGQALGRGYRRTAFAPVRNRRGSPYRARAPPAA
jgi:hypothetical protein